MHPFVYNATRGRFGALMEAEGGRGGGGADDAAALAAQNAQLKKDLADRDGQISTLNASVSDLTARLKTFDGIDPAEVRTMLERQRKAEQDAEAARRAAEEAQLAAQGEWDRLKARMAEEHQSELTRATGDLSTQLTTVNEQLAASNRLISDLTVGAAFSGSKWLSENLVLPAAKARVVFGDHFDIEEGRVVGYDKPRGAADRTKLVDARGNPIAFELAIQKIVETDPDRDNMMRSKIRAGAGSGTDNGAPPAPAVGHGVAKILAGLKKK